MSGSSKGNQQGIQNKAFHFFTEEMVRESHVAQNLTRHKL
jgi:hypothetical protein